LAVEETASSVAFLRFALGVWLYRLRDNATACSLATNSSHLSTKSVGRFCSQLMSLSVVEGFGQNCTAKRFFRRDAIHLRTHILARF
jgi:hypothetical protein